MAADSVAFGGGTGDDLRVAGGEAAEDKKGGGDVFAGEDIEQARSGE